MARDPAAILPDLAEWRAASLRRLRKSREIAKPEFLAFWLFGNLYK
jgi:hypothetical protein